MGVLIESHQNEKVKEGSGVCSLWEKPPLNYSIPLISILHFSQVLILNKNLLWYFMHWKVIMFFFLLKSWEFLESKTIYDISARLKKKKRLLLDILLLRLKLFNSIPLTTIHNLIGTQRMWFSLLLLLCDLESITSFHHLMWACVNYN